MTRTRFAGLNLRAPMAAACALALTSISASASAEPPKPKHPADFEKRPARSVEGHQAMKRGAHHMAKKGHGSADIADPEARSQPQDPVPDRDYTPGGQSSSSGPSSPSPTPH
jgi:hypothetical protein